jgi:uncharacterized protein with ParB-like and HNH nuclease domain
MSIALEKIPSEVQDEFSDTSPYRILSFPADFTLKGLHDKFLSDEIVIPPFQRQYVWNVERASKLIESFLLGLPVPGVFLYREKKSQKLIVIDGQQRLVSVFGFFDGKFPTSGKRFYLKGVRPIWDGKIYEKLDDADQIRLRDSVLRATIIEQVDPADHSSMFHIFERLNTGGVSLRPQEIRNCIHQGSFNDLLKALNQIDVWRDVVGSDKADKRMRDIELILRFFALLYEHPNYRKPMKDFISDFMARNKDASQSKLDEFKRVFVSTVENVRTTLGRRPFHIKKGLNAAVFDSIMVAFGANKLKVPENIKDRYKELLNNEAYQSYISTATTDVDTVKGRIALASQKLFRK